VETLMTSTHNSSPSHEHKPTPETSLPKGVRNGWMACALLCLTLLALWAVTAAQDQPDQSNRQAQEVPASAIVTKSVQAIGFEVGRATRVDFKGTELMPDASGQARIEIRSGAGTTSVNAQTRGLKPPSVIGTEFLTYVLWAITPQGHTENLGEIQINKRGEGRLNATTPAQTFGLIITAEPYFAVRLPSEMVVLESQARRDTRGKIFPVSQYNLLRRAQYERMENPLALSVNPNIPLEMYQARNAVAIARSRGADKYAPDSFQKAEANLKMAEDSLASGANRNTIIAQARQTVQFSEDARAIAVRRQEEQRIAQERDAAAATARAQAEATAAAEAAEARRKADEQMAAQQREAEQRHQATLAQAQRDKQQLRAKLLDQFNRVLPTTDTSRGLVVNMGDVLFDTGKSNLRQPAREALARLSGIVLNYPGLHLTIEGHTDSTGSAEFNQTLSQDRADAVRDFLVSQGLNSELLTAEGLGMHNPTADNSTAEGRQRNRRVEIIVSGEVIGTPIGTRT
jgi:outer membrane protein OmpA-like peptidoglycan-associated protein